MAIILNLKENNNELRFLDAPKDIICGNNNYQLNVEFDEDWSEFENKTAVFSINGKNNLVDFSGGTVEVPAMPNAQCLIVYFMASNLQGKNLVTTPLCIKLIPTGNGLSDEQFEQAENYLLQLRESVLDIQSGELSVAYAQRAGESETQVSLSGDQTISGTKNFIGVLQSGGNNVLNCMQISNPNLLINGDFKVNQRGKTTYSTANKYTVDRWKLVSGSLTVEESGITLNGTIMQKLEHTPTGEVVCSVDKTGGSPSISYSNGAVIITTTTATLIKWAKLEMGEYATPFSPKPISQELSDCQRYYYAINSTNASYSSYGASLYGYHQLTSAYFKVNLPRPLRTNPTLIFDATKARINYGHTLFVTPSSSSDAGRHQYIANTTIYWIGINNLAFSSNINWGACVLNGNNVVYSIELDAEIY